MKTTSTTPGISRRDFVKNTAAVAAVAAVGLGPLRGAEKPETRKMIGVQVGAVSFVDEGVGKVLDILQERAAAGAGGGAMSWRRASTICAYMLLICYHSLHAAWLAGFFATFLQQSRSSVVLITC